MAVNGQNQQLSNLVNNYSYLRSGTVSAVDPILATVDVGGTVIRAAYVRQSEPVIGDTVAITRQGASWFIHGTSSASGDNLVQNPSFEEINEDGTPALWSFTVATNVSVVQVIENPQAVDGTHVAQVSNPGTLNSVSRLYSAPIAVTVGSVIELSAYVNGLYPAGGAGTTDIQLQALWFANATDLYPTTSDADSTVDQVTNITQEDDMRVLRGTVTVPAGAVFVRAGMRTAADAGNGASYDFVTLRTVS